MQILSFAPFGASKLLIARLLFVLSVITSSNLIFAAEGTKIVGIESENYPSIQLMYYHFDTSGYVSNHTAVNISLFDNAIKISNSDVNCPSDKDYSKLSLNIAFDLAIDANKAVGSNFEIAREVAENLSKLAAIKNSEVSLTSFDANSYLNKDFTQAYDTLEMEIKRLDRSRGSHFNSGLLALPAGAFQIVNRGKYLKTVLLISNGSSNADSDSIISLCRQNGIRLFAISIGNNISESIKTACIASGGLWLSNVGSYKSPGLIASTIFAMMANVNPCTVQFNAENNCDSIHEFKIVIQNQSTSSDIHPFKPHTDKLPQIISEPKYLAFGGVLAPATKELDVRIKALNKDLKIDSLTITDFRISISEGDLKDFVILQGNDHLVKIRYTPADSAIIFAKLLIHSNDVCLGKELLITAGYPNTPPHERTVRLEYPDCGEKLVIGDTVNIAWSGLLPKDVIQLELSTNGGQNWDTLAYDVNNLSHEWIVPDIESDSCLIRLIQLWPNNIGRTMNFWHNKAVNSAMFNIDESLIVTASDDTSARVWNAFNGKELIRLIGHTQPILWAEFSNDGEYIVTCGQDSLAILWNAHSGSMIRKFIGHTYDVRAARFSRDGRNILTAGRDGYAFIWDTQTGKLIDTLDYSPVQFWFAEFSPDGNYALLSGNDRQVKLWDWRKKIVEKIYDTGIAQEGQGLNVHAGFSKDGNKIVTSSWFGKAIVWDRATEVTITTVSHLDSVGRGSAVFFGSFDGTGDTLLTGGFDHNINMWDANSGEFIVQFFEHTSSVKSALFNFDASRVLTSSWDGTAKIWNRNKRDLQTDTSDCIFRIIRARVDVKDVLFGSVAVGDPIDTVLQGFISNRSKGKIKIKDIKITGIANADYTILNGFAPFYLDSGETKTIEIRFRPTNLGIRPANLEVIIPNDTVISELMGEGIFPAIEKQVKYIDFGKIDIGDNKDSLVNPIITNKYFDQLIIDSIGLIGPDLMHFDIIDGSAPLKMNPEASASMRLRFTPRNKERYSTQLLFRYNGIGSPTKLILFGEGVLPKIDTVTISIESFSAMPGELRNVGIYIKNQTDEPISELIKGFAAELRFNSTLLEPISFAGTSRLNNNERILSLNLPYPGLNDSLLSYIQFKTALGNDSVTQLILENIRPLSNSKIKIFEQSGKFSLLGICEEGGSRLFTSEGESYLSQNSPNPINDITSIEYEIIEKSNVELFITDLMGSKRLVLVNEYHNPGRYVIDFNASLLPSGFYYYTLKTETQNLVRRMFISK